MKKLPPNASYLDKAVKAALVEMGYPPEWSEDGGIVTRSILRNIKIAEPFIAKHYEEKARKAVLAQISSLHPHEVGCHCEMGGVFGWEPHAKTCPRHQIGAMLAAMTSQKIEEAPSDV